MAFERRPYDVRAVPFKVPSKYLISLDRWTNNEFNIGKFRDIGHIVGVNRFNQAGGAIMEDFDNDGRLDIVVSTFDLPSNGTLPQQRRRWLY